MLADKRLDLVRIDLCTGLQRDHGARFLAKRRVRNGHERRVHDRVVSIKDVLHFGRIDVLATADDDVLGAVDNVTEALIVETREIACPQPTVDERGRGLFRTVPISLDHMRAAHQKFADAPCRQRGAARVDHLHVGDRRSRAAAVGTEGVILADVVGERRTGLGHAPATAGAGLRKILVQPPHQFRRRRRATIGDRLDAGEIIFLARWMLQQLPRDGWHSTDRVDALALDQPKRLLRIPSARDHDEGADGNRDAEGREAAGDVEERDGQELSLLLGIRTGRRRYLAATQERSDLRKQGGEHGCRDGTVIGDRALRHAGRAGCIEQRRLVARLDGDGRRAGLGQTGPASRFADELLQSRDGLWTVAHKA